MLSKTAHIVYITVIVVLLAALLMQRGSVPGESQPRIEHDAINVAADDAAGQDDEIIKELSPLNTGESIDVSRAAVDDRRMRGSPGDPGWDRGFRPDANRTLSAEMVTRCVEVASDIDADLGSRLAKLREKDPAALERQLRRSQEGRRLLAMAQLKDREPDLYRSKLGELSQVVDINRVASELREAMRTNADPSRIEALKAQLRSRLQVQFAMSIKSRGDYLCRIEEQITRVRDDIDREIRHYQATIEARMKHLMQSPEQPIADQTEPIQPPSTAVPASSKMVQPN